jgi:hypothetical protein
MSVYSGWQKDLLAAVRLPDTKQNVAFLNAWHKHAESDCDLNPIDLTSKNSGSNHCKDTGLIGRSFQRYDKRVWTRTAFAAQIESGRYPHLRRALESGNPYTAKDWSPIVDDLSNWHSGKFATYWVKLNTPAKPPKPPKATHALGGWSDLRKSINRGLPQTLAHSQRVNRATLRTLHRARKVKL